MARAFLGLLAVVFAVIVAARFAYSVSTDIGDDPVQEAWAQNKIEFVTWNNKKWTGWIHDGKFELIPQDSSNWSRHASPSIAFTNWEGESVQAKIDDDSFLLAAEGNWQGETARAEAIRYLDWNGNNQLRTVADLQR
jgi:hypothetical protein